MSKVVLLLVVVCAVLGASAVKERVVTSCASADVLMMELSAKLPAHNRWTGDPCTDNAQCASGLCVCVDGGRHCVTEKDCPADGAWPATHAGELATLFCTKGLTGARLRKCEVDGEWSEETNTCKKPACPREDEWPETLVGETATLSCSSGSGSRTRTCQIGAIWGAPASDCNGPQCPALGIWPAAPIGSHVQLPCAPGLIGHQSRFCTLGGTWQEDINNQCKQPGCPEDDVWPATDVKTFATLPCEEGLVGSKRRFCQEDAVWGDAQNSCYSMCAAVGPWPQTRTGHAASLECGEGFTGEKTRDCREDGSWSDIQDHCEETAPGCPAEEDWPATAPGTEANLPCKGGTRYRFCSDYSMWEDVWDAECKK